MVRKIAALTAALAYSADALAPKKAGLFQGRYDAAAGTFKTEQLRAASFDEFQLDATSAAASPAGQLYTADGAPLMTAPCCIKARRPRLIHAIAAQPREDTIPRRSSASAAAAATP